MASKIAITLDLLIFVILIIVYYLLQLSEEKNCKCITKDNKIYYKIIKFTIGFLIVSSIVFQNIVNFPIFIKEIFGVINILLIPFIYIIFMIYFIRNECSCFVDNHLLNKILFVSDSFSLINLIVICTIMLCLMFGMVPLTFTILTTVPPNSKFYDISWAIIKCEFILGIIFSSMLSMIIISKSKMKHKPRSMYDPRLKKWRQDIWDETLNKYVYIDDQVDTVITVSN